jgi:DNA ligase-1
MTAYYVKQLNSSDSRLHKESVIESILSAAIVGFKNAEIFLNLLHCTYNPYITFGVKQVPDSNDIEGAENPWEDFVNMINLLTMRGLTGNLARDAINTMMSRFDSEEWNLVCAPVLRKDIRCGISDKTINKVVKKTKYEIPVFGCQLATSCEGRPEMRGLKRLEPKLDGVRMLLQAIPCDDGSVTILSYSRNGKIFENFKHIEDQIAENFSKIVRDNVWMINGFVLDGEVMGRSFQDLMKQARRKEKVDSSDTVYHVFDLIPLDDFIRGYWNTPQAARMKLLENRYSAINSLDNVTFVPHIVVNLDTAEGRDVFQRYCNDKVNEGYEGVMIKDMDAPYECKRSTFWLKYKPVITVDLEVVNVEEGTGRNVGRLGALVCMGEDNGRSISVNVGSGFSDDDRSSWWNVRGDVIGRTVEVLADAVTQNQDGTYSLRFPRFQRFRDTFTGEKE